MVQCTDKQHLAFFRAQSMLLYYVLVCDASLSQDFLVEGLAIADFPANCCCKIQRFSHFFILANSQPSIENYGLMLSLLIPLLSVQGFHFTINLAGVHFSIKWFCSLHYLRLSPFLVESIGIVDISDFFH